MGKTYSITMRKQQTRKRRMLWCSAILVLLLVTLSIGLGVGLNKKNGASNERGSSNTQMLLPLYSEPETVGTWKPLYDQLEAHPNVNFTIILNTNNGSMIPSELSQAYKDSLASLKISTNAQIIGYIDTNQSSRTVAQVLDEGREYAAWSPSFGRGGVGLDGLYYDNVPKVKANQGVFNYLSLMDWIVKTGDAFGPRRLVVHNTGVIPAYFDNTTDVTVVFDGTYKQYLARRDELSELPKDQRMSRGLMVKSVPTSGIDLKDVVREMSGYAGNLHLTGLSPFLREDFGNIWEEFVAAVADLQA